MKKLNMLLVLILVLSISTKTNAYHMYAPDGRYIEVDYNDAQLWRNVGWYDNPVTELWSNDGRQIIVYKSEADMYKKCGWYDANEKVTIYAPDGRTASIKRYQLQSYLNVGWYDYPVTTMYAYDGRTIVVATTDVAMWRNVGWFESPLIFLGKSFDWLSNYFGELQYEFDYEGGNFYSSSSSMLNFGFDSENINFYSPCVTVVASLKNVFPDLAAKANQNGYISKEQISEFFKYSYEYEYDEFDCEYTGFAKIYNSFTNKINTVVFFPEYDGSCNINYDVLILNKTPL